MPLNGHTHLHSTSSSGYSSGGSSYIFLPGSRPPVSAQASIISATSSSSYISFPGQTAGRITTSSPLSTSPTSTTAPDSPQHLCLCQEDSDGESEESRRDNLAMAEVSELPSAHRVWPISHDYINMPQPLLLKDIHNFALQIASGLEHLKEMKVDQLVCLSVCQSAAVCLSVCLPV